MNVLRLGADMLHLAAFITLLATIIKNNSCTGVSLKTQQLYLLSFLTRYLDVFTSFISIYNTFMKCAFIGLATAIVYYIRSPCRESYNEEKDSFPVWTICALSLVFGLLFTERDELLEIVWTFSLFIEAVAIIPQTYMLSLTTPDALPLGYVLTMASYCVLSLVNYWYRYLSESYAPYNMWLSGAIRLSLFAVFCYVWKFGVDYSIFDFENKEQENIQATVPTVPSVDVELLPVVVQN